MIKKSVTKVRIVEGHPADPSLKEYITFGLSATKDDMTYRIDDITDDREALDAFVEKLNNTDFEPWLIKELADDFLTERYGL